MIANFYAVKDIKSGFLAPMVDTNDDIAARKFSFALQKPGTLEYANIQDFQLFYIGKFNDETGVLIPEEHRLVLDGASLLKVGE